ncbi:hypothetical protein M728_001789 [Ensifer sp. WSM1721]|uniref:hypothetical protein n=1 Tax=Ensifer sp. WSM1721 TaxID=1041159 RepID=UPI0012EC027B|nr:hypothetical protein [Ensifer sp. WSM1721]
MHKDLKRLRSGSFFFSLTAATFTERSTRKPHPTTETEGCGRENRVRYALPDPDLRQSPAAGKQLSRQRYRMVIEPLTKGEFRFFLSLLKTASEAIHHDRSRRIQEVDFSSGTLRLLRGD